MIGQKFLPSRVVPFHTSLDLFPGAKTSCWLPSQQRQIGGVCLPQEAQNSAQCWAWGRSSENVPLMWNKKSPPGKSLHLYGRFPGRCKTQFFPVISYMLCFTSGFCLPIPLPPFTLYGRHPPPTHTHLSQGKGVTWKPLYNQLCRSPLPHLPHEIQKLQATGSLNLK